MIYAFLVAITPVRVFFPKGLLPGPLAFAAGVVGAAMLLPLSWEYGIGVAAGLWAGLHRT